MGCISLPLLTRVKEELNHMEQQGVISKEEEPTEWCAPVVVVPKHTDISSVRICTDLTEQNDDRETPTPLSLHTT